VGRLPDKGFCEAVAGYQINQGHFGDVQLDGLRAAAVWHWPGAVHEGNGTMQPIIGERADAGQRDALVKILAGQETEDMATVWWVFSATCPTKHPPLFKSIDLEVDVDARRARLEVPGMVHSMGEPFRNRLPVASTGCGSTSRKASNSAWPRSGAVPARRPARSRSI
jgi:hypothetical protein